MVSLLNCGTKADEILALTACLSVKSNMIFNISLLIERNANQNLSEVSSHIRQNGYHQKPTNNYAAEGMEKQEPYTVNGNANQSNHCGEQYGDSSA